ncbi:MAG: cytidylate kinase-like family protein [Phycisphaerae bacterium]|nr:cytidylate kinase-like family protein [Phycisphaerae bacterium]
MPAKPSSGKTDIAKIVERQMRNWELAHGQRIPAPDAGAHAVQHFVAISRTLGSGGSQVAALLGERLHWPVFDRQILQAMAGDDQMRTRLYEHLDERDTSWIEDTLRWLIAGDLRKDDYFYRLTEAVLALARRGHGIFLGRGADLILPREYGLRVRITAGLDQRTARFALQSNIPEHMARAEIERVDRERADFRRRHFGADANDDTRHDLVLNMDRFTPPQAVEMILAALRLRCAIV